LNRLKWSFDGCKIVTGDSGGHVKVLDVGECGKPGNNDWKILESTLKNLTPPPEQINTERTEKSRILEKSLSFSPGISISGNPLSLSDRVPDAGNFDEIAEFVNKKDE